MLFQQAFKLLVGLRSFCGLVALLLLPHAVFADLSQSETEQVLLVCEDIPASLFHKIMVVRGAEGLQTRILLEEVVYQESIHEIEWIQGNLTLPNIENHAHRLVYFDEPEMWNLSRYSIDGVVLDWVIPCQRLTAK